MAVRELKNGDREGGQPCQTMQGLLGVKILIGLPLALEIGAI
jgi:hypothetical protein